MCVGVVLFWSSLCGWGCSVVSSLSVWSCGCGFDLFGGMCVCVPVFCGRCLVSCGYVSASRCMCEGCRG